MAEDTRNVPDVAAEAPAPRREQRTIKLHGRVVLNLREDERKALNHPTSVVVVEKGVHVVNDSGAPGTVMPWVAEHPYVIAHCEKPRGMPAHVATAPQQNGDPVATEAGRLRAEKGDAVVDSEDSDEVIDADVVKPVDEMSDDELFVHVRTVTGRKPGRQATRAQLIAMLPATE